MVILLAWWSAIAIQAQDCQIEFSQDAGFYDTPFVLQLKSEHQSIFYTLDGAEPNKNSSQYFGGGIKIDTNKVVRAAIIQGDTICGKIFTQSYFINFDTNGFPVWSLAVDPYHLWDSNRGIYVKGVRADTIYPWVGANYYKSWEKPVHTEFFEEDKSPIISQDAGLRIFGGMTRTLREKSLRIVASKSRYGKKHFKHKFFPDKDLRKFKHIVLRTSGGDYNQSRFRDALAIDVIRDLDLDHQAFRFCLLFINGEYWGIYNIREKINEHFLKDNRGADPDQTDIIKLNSERQHGSSLGYRAMEKFIRKNSLQKTENYVKLNEEYMDVRNYMNYRIAQIYYSNIDSRGNIRYWRAANLDNRFRWIVYDIDLGFGASGYANKNYLAKRISPIKTDWYNPEWSTFLLRNLLKNQEFKNEFLQQYAFLLNDHFHADSVLAKVDWFVNKLEPEMPRHLKRRDGLIPQSMKGWHRQVEKIRRFVRDRPKYARKNAIKVFDLHGQFTLNLKSDPPYSCTYKVNKNEVHKPTYQGIFFKEVPMEVEAIPKPYYTFKTWRGSKSNFDKAIIPINTWRDELPLTAQMEKKPASEWSGKLIINELYIAKDSTDHSWLELYNQSGQRMDLSGFILSKGSIDFALPDSTFLKDRAFLLLSTAQQKPKKFKKKMVTSMNFDLSWEESLSLYTAEGNMLDSIYYNVDSISTTLAKHQGLSLELQDPKLDNNNPSLWLWSTPSPARINAQYEHKLSELFWHNVKLWSLGLLIISLIGVYLFMRWKKSKTAPPEKP